MCVYKYVPGRACARAAVLRVARVGSGGRVYFHYYNLDDLITQLKKSNFDQVETFKVKYKTSETEFDIHTILTAKKKTF